MHGARLDGGNPVVEVFACLLVDIFAVFVSHVAVEAVLLLFFAPPITTAGSVARECN